MPDVQFTTVPSSGTPACHKESAEITASRGPFEEECERFSCGEQAGKLTGIKTNPGDTTGKCISQSMHARACVCVCICVTLFIYSSLWGKQYHHACEGRESGGIKAAALGKVPHSLQAVSRQRH